jgi:chromate reductase
VLAISGSLRAKSINGEVLSAMIEISGDDVDFTIFAGLSELPFFNADHDIETPPASVAEWRAQLRECDAVVISSPEYAHGVPGVLKNALDWTVGSGEFMHKPVSIVNASESSLFVGPQLTETLTVMMATVVPAACVTLKLAGKKRDALSMRLDEEIAQQLRDVFTALTRAVDDMRTADTSTAAPRIATSDER